MEAALARTHTPGAPSNDGRLQYYYTALAALYAYVWIMTCNKYISYNNVQNMNEWTANNELKLLIHKSETTRHKRRLKWLDTLITRPETPAASDTLWKKIRQGRKNHRVREDPVKRDQ